MDRRLTGKVAVIVGGAGGIGSQICRAFLKEGAEVAVGDLQEADLSTDTEERGRYHFQRTDARSGEEVAALIQKSVDIYGCIDILVNNAGVSCRGSVMEVDEFQFDQVFDTNVKSVYHGCRSVLPLMLERNYGSIINMASNGGVVARANDPVYSASKHAVVGLTKSMAATYAHHNIRVNAVCPGPIDTPMLRRGAANEEEFLARLPTLLGSCPAGRYGTTDEVAAAAMFLASDESSFVNGLALTVDGGKGAATLPNDRYRWVPSVGHQVVR